MRQTLVSLVLALALLSCSPKPQASGPERHYPFSGQVVALDAKSQTATIAGAAIPNFMEAMTMDYPIKSRAEFNTLHVGDKIKATVAVSASGDDYHLSGIQKQNSPKP